MGLLEAVLAYKWEGTQTSLPYIHVGDDFSYISFTLTSLPTILQTVSRAIFQNHTSYIVNSPLKIFPSPYHLLNWPGLNPWTPLTSSYLNLCWGSARTMHMQALWTLPGSAQRSVITSVISRIRFSHISGQQEDFEHSWFERTGAEKERINTNNSWSFWGELKGKLVYRAWHLVKSSINVSLFSYNPLTSCWSEMSIVLLKGRSREEESGSWG